MSVTSSFSATGVSSTLTTSKPFNLSLTSAAWGSVTLQRRLDGTNWRDVETFTANAERIVGEKTNEDVEYRLNCTAYSAAIAYAMKS